MEYEPLFDLSPEERTFIFIDGRSLYASARALDMEVDFKKLHDYVAEQTNLRRVTYCATYLEGVEENSSVRRLIDWLEYNGFYVVARPIYEFVDADGRKKIKVSAHSDMIVQMMEATEFADHILLFSGDKEFLPVVEACQRRGIIVTVVSLLSVDRGQPYVADELRRQANRFVCLSKIRPILAKYAR